MRVAFVGVKRKYQELPKDYVYNFNRYHLELPFYYARDGENEVTITTVDMNLGTDYFRLIGDGYKHPRFLEMQLESDFVKSQEKFDIVVHWRKWFPELYRPKAINLINCQDHSFGQEWRVAASRAFREGKLYGILCFPIWHKQNLLEECPWLPEDRALAGMTLGVDSWVYRPQVEKPKDPYQMLWASDPGRGLAGAIKVALRLFQRDKRFRLHVTYPDYVKHQQPISHPAIVWHGIMSNGPELWDLFNTTGIMPYTSMFPEPSSRSHRQAMSAGSLVLYPPKMGTPSYMIHNGETGIVSDPSTWPDKIIELVESGGWRTIGIKAREYSISENWEVQARRFNELFSRLLGDRR